LPVVLITGASTGIGNALAKELARRGWTVGLVARRSELLLTLAAEIEAAGGKAACAAADVTDAAAIRDAALHIAATLGPIDLMVANAGTGLPTRATTVPIDAWMQIMRLNVDGAIYSVGAVLPEMVVRKAGHLAVVSSVAGYRGLPMSAAYSASKAAVSTFFESLRVDLRTHGIAVTTIHPGFITTPLTAKNKFPMPFLISAERAAVLMADGLERRRSDITFPWQMRILMRWVRYLPNALYDAILSRNRVL
jgi:NADP-dependent 3-hydroxy acid dehydrogenase YdfG